MFAPAPNGEPLTSAWRVFVGRNAGTFGPMKIALRNVRVFDGRQLLPPGTVVLDGDRIGSDASGAKMVVDGAGAALLPGLTDAHLHIDGRPALERLVRFGVTTALDMANAPPEFVDLLRGIAGLTDFRSAGTAALAPGSIHSYIPEIGERGLIRSAADAEQFVTERFAEGSDFLKILIDLRSPTRRWTGRWTAPPRSGWRLRAGC
jgi:hypothetical protein